MTPNARLLAAFRSLTPTDRQNRMMRIGDREIAMAMMYMQAPERALMLSHLGPEKVRRVREELALHERLAIRYDDYLHAVALVLRNLEVAATRRTALGSYLRPRGRDGRR